MRPRRIKPFPSRRLTIRQLAAVAIGFCGMFAVFLTVLVFNSYYGHSAEEYNTPWHYKCVAGLCKKTEITEDVAEPLSFGVCQLTCGQYGNIWPKPTGHFSLGDSLVQLDPTKVELSGVEPRSAAGTLLQTNIELLKQNVRKLAGTSAKSAGNGLVVHLANALRADNVKLTLDTDERYTLEIHQLGDGRLNASITAKSYFGARHALETLTQLVVVDELRNQTQIIRDAYIVDGPVYPYRGVLLDTARNYMDKRSILRTIEAMSMSKLNTFHWHITDSQSFPYVSRTFPRMSWYGAYAPSKVYTEEDIREIVEYALVRGVRVLPEFDAPAHVGEGWQWVGGNATVCFKAEPWQSYCVEPPCGQLNPTSERVYEILEGIYADMLRDFRQPDVFHMGGDEVNVNCWRSSSVITDWMRARGWDLSDSSFYLLWDYFQARAYERLQQANGGRQIPAVLWTSGLTSEENLKYLDPDKYIIQIWTSGSDAAIARLLRNNFRTILSNYDALYLDCGFGAWVGEGNNWCSPYKGWQKIYENSPLRVATQQGFPNKKHLLLGAEVTLWSEQVDSISVDSRLWPRSAAMAERLWAEPDSAWMHAEQRMLKHRERLVERGILADSLEPEWCRQNQGHCYL